MKLPKITKTKIVLIVCFMVILALALIVALVFRNKFRDLTTLEKIDDYPLYTMHYECDYKLDTYLEQGITDTISDSVRRVFFPDSIWNVLKNLKIVRNDVTEPVTACATIFTVNGKGEKILGRNFDWINRPILLLETKPGSGLSSCSMVDISYLGYNEKFLPDSVAGASFALVFSPYVSFDGMNEKGLAVGQMSVPGRYKPRQDPGKVTIGDTNSIRMILDKATTVDEAVSLLGKYNVNYPTLAWHYLIADREGNSSIIEYVDGQMVETRKDRNFQICTNDIVYNRTEDEKQRLCKRYNRAYKVMDETNGDIDQFEMMKLLEGISQNHTMWSVVYNMTTGNVLVVPGKKYGNVYQYTLKMSNR